MYVDEIVLAGMLLLTAAVFGLTGWLIGYEWTRRFVQRELEGFGSELRLTVIGAPDRAPAIAWRRYLDQAAEELIRGEAIAWRDDDGKSVVLSSRYWLGEEER
jgi:hypothetical protein